MAKHKPAKMLAVLGRCRRTGRWRVGRRSVVLAVLGACRLDMRSSFVEDDEDEMKMKVTVFLGSAVFILPDGAEVRPSGMSVLSVSLVDVPEHPEPSGLPTLEIEWTCVLGRLQIVTGPALELLEAAAVEAKAAGRKGRGNSKSKGRKKDVAVVDVEASVVEPLAAEPVAVLAEGVLDSDDQSGFPAEVETDEAVADTAAVEAEAEGPVVDGASAVDEASVAEILISPSR